MNVSDVFPMSVGNPSEVRGQMQIVRMIWNGIDGLGSGTVALKSLFILVAAVMVWAVCELVKYLADLSVKLAKDALRALAIKVRGMPIEKAEGKKDTVPIYRVNR